MTDTSKEAVVLSAEEAAKIIYERAMRYLRLDVPEWVEGGNSLAQGEARSIAATILSERDALRAQLQEARDDNEGISAGNIRPATCAKSTWCATVKRSRTAAKRPQSRN